MSALKTVSRAPKQDRVSAQGKKPPRKWMKIGVPVVAGLLVFGAGTLTGESGSQEEIEQLTASEVALNAQLEQAEADREAAVQELESVRSEAGTSSEKLTALEAEAQERESELSKLEEENAALAKTNDDLEERVGQLESAAENDQTATTVSTEDEQVADPGTSTYYPNCTAAREAGAAPVHRGDPGYGRHLDRDGDGVGCE